MTFMNAIYGRIKTFRWKEKVWLIIEDEGVYEMVADEKKKKGISCRLNVPYVLSIYIHIQIDGAFVDGLYGSERAGMVALGIVIKS